MDPAQASTETTHDVLEEGASAMVATGHPHVSTKTGGCEEQGPSHLPMMRIPTPGEQAPGPTSSIPDSEATEEITVTDQDVLFGRGGLTNHHIGNLRYRDIIELHRQDYVHAPKIEKPNVARRIVKAIRTDPNPGRFLRKDALGMWREVDEKEASWKASQALREKTRWASMKKDTEASKSSDTAFALSDVMLSTSMKVVVESATTSAVKKAKKRSAIDTQAMSDDELKEENSDANTDNTIKKAKCETPGSIEVIVPTKASHIAVPPVESQAGKKATSYIIPKDEDILFGRGGRTNHHPGNVRLREIVDQYRRVYAEAKKLDKPNVAKLIVGALRSAHPPSRFLKLNEATSRWEDVGDRRAAEKVSQTLREKDRTNPNTVEDGLSY